MPALNIKPYCIDSNLKAEAVKGNKVNKELLDYLNSEKIKSAIQKIPSEDALFINASYVKRNFEGDYKASNPEIIYIKDYYNLPKPIKHKKLDKNSKEFEIDLEKGLDKKALKKWINKLIPKEKAASENFSCIV